MTESTSDWLTVTEAAKALGISERQARRYAGRLAPDDRREAGHEIGHMTGALVRLEAMAAEREKATGRAKASQSTLRPDTGPDVEPDTKQAEAGRDDRPRPDVTPDADQSTLTSHLLEENRFLRAALEARDRDAAELRAALREALKISSRALVESTSTEAIQGDLSGQSTLIAQVPPMEAKAPQTGYKREARPFWKVFLGIR
jgi:hypothetical protein